MANYNNSGPLPNAARQQAGVLASRSTPLPTTVPVSPPTGHPAHPALDMAMLDRAATLSLNDMHTITSLWAMVRDVPTAGPTDPFWRPADEYFPRRADVIAWLGSCDTYEIAPGMTERANAARLRQFTIDDIMRAPIPPLFRLICGAGISWREIRSSPFMAMFAYATQTLEVAPFMDVAAEAVVNCYDLIEMRGMDPHYSASWWQIQDDVADDLGWRDVARADAVSAILVGPEYADKPDLMACDDDDLRTEVIAATFVSWATNFRPDAHVRAAYSRLISVRRAQTQGRPVDSACVRDWIQLLPLRNRAAVTSQCDELDRRAALLLAAEESATRLRMARVAAQNLTAAQDRRPAALRPLAVADSARRLPVPHYAFPYGVTAPACVLEAFDAADWIADAARFALGPTDYASYAEWGPPEHMYTGDAWDALPERIALNAAKPAFDVSDRWPIIPYVADNYVRGQHVLWTAFLPELTSGLWLPACAEVLGFEAGARLPAINEHDLDLVFNALSEDRVADPPATEPAPFRVQSLGAAAVHIAFGPPPGRVKSPPSRSPLSNRFVDLVPPDLPPAAPNIPEGVADASRRHAHDVAMAVARILGHDPPVLAALTAPAEKAAYVAALKSQAPDPDDPGPGALIFNKAYSDCGWASAYRAWLDEVLRAWELRLGRGLRARCGLTSRQFAPARVPRVKHGPPCLQAIGVHPAAPPPADPGTEVALLRASAAPFEPGRALPWLVPGD